MRNLLARIKSDHPRTDALRSAAEGCIAAAESFAAKKADLAKGNRYTPAGLAAALREALPGHAAQLETARAPIAKLAREAKQRRMALKVPTPDKTDLAGAIERAEIREFIRGMGPGERAGLLAGTKDVRILEAALSAPPELSGLTGNMESFASQIEDRYLEIKYGEELKAVTELENVVSEAAAVAQVARGAIRSAAGMDERQFDALVGPAEKKAGAPWLVKSGNSAPMVVEVGDDGKASYRAATDWETRAGVYYADQQEWEAARAAA